MFCTRHIGLEIERNRGYCMKPPKNFQDGSYSIDDVFMPVRNTNHSVHSYGNGNEKQYFQGNTTCKSLDTYQFSSILV
jgi:hypothetical protein